MTRFFRNIGRGVKDFFIGTPEKRENVSTLRPEQEDLYSQLVKSGMQPGAGGAFGGAADYYRGNLSNDPQDFNSFADPARRQYFEETVPNLSEQFAGMGAGGLGSSGFRNAALQSGVDLGERLAQMRANLRQQSAQGLANIGQIGLNPYSQNMTTQQGTPGFLSQIAPSFSNAALQYFMPQGGGSGGQGSIGVGAKTDPYGGQYKVASPSLTNWNYNTR